MDERRIVAIEGTALPLRGNDIDTDRILPARFLRAISFEGFEAHVFVDDRAEALKAGGRHPFDVPAYQGASVLLVNSNFGCGSSREHAPQGLRRWGIRAVIGESFSEIFFGNSLMIGMACLTASHEDIDAMMRAVEQDPSTQVHVDLAKGRCEVAGRQYSVAVPTPARDALMSGAWDLPGLLRDRFDEVTATAARLPYIAGF